MLERKPLHGVSRIHLEVLTDEIGIMQHAIGSVPDPAHGYCTDDVARALTVDLLHQRELGWPAVADSARRSLQYLSEAFDASSGRFRNFRRVDGSWLDGPPSEDSNGRAMLALGETIGSAPDAWMVDRATSLFEQALDATESFTALRAVSSVIMGCNAAMRGAPRASTARAYRSLASRLASTFDARQAGAWPWPEPRLTYENALPLQAMIVSGRFIGSRRMVDDAIDVLDWLIATQTHLAGHFSPIGNGWWTTGGVKSRFDQQPIEATSLLLAAETAYEATAEERYRTAMERAYAWFLGANDIGQPIADPERGASHDALTPHGVNTNQGAESTLMWLIALEHIRAVRAVEPSIVSATNQSPARAGGERRLATAAR